MAVLADAGGKVGKGVAMEVYVVYSIGYGSIAQIRAIASDGIIGLKTNRNGQIW